MDILLRARFAGCCVGLCMMGLTSSMASAIDAVDYERQTLEVRREASEYAAGPTGYYAIQDVSEMQPGQSAFLTADEQLDAVHWSQQPIQQFIARVDYNDGHAILSGPGLQTIDLLQVPGRPATLPDGLTVNASFLRKTTTLRARVYNPRLPALKHFKSLDFFPYRDSGVVPGEFHRYETPRAVTFLDSRDKEGVTYEVGSVTLLIDGKSYDVSAYSIADHWADIDMLSLMFKDQTSGKTTYGGGRLVDVSFPKGAPPKTMRVNLNVAYSFSCAYSSFYSCPLVLAKPLPVKLEYGEKYPPLKHCASPAEKATC